jgi:MFS superfamily sulfate permease-like transporter
VALPVSIAYAQLAGFHPVVGLYSSILPLVAYAIFGTSRQLMVNPDAATCAALELDARGVAGAMIAAAIAPPAGNSAELYLSLTTALTLLTGLFCVAASYFRLGALADFLSKPILVGFPNGIAISIFLGQIGKLLGFSVESSGVIPRLLEVLGKIPLIHGATLAVGARELCVTVCVFAVAAAFARGAGGAGRGWCDERAGSRRRSGNLRGRTGLERSEPVVALCVGRHEQLTP